MWSSRRGSRSIEHLGSARDGVGVAALRAAGAQRWAAGQAELDLGVVQPSGSELLPITSWRSAHLWDALTRAYEVLGFDEAAGADEVVPKRSPNTRPSWQPAHQYCQAIDEMSVVAIPVSVPQRTR